MHHVPDGRLRRLVDDRLAVPDSDAEHVLHCRRCQDHRDRVVGDAHVAREALARPQPLPDLDRAWARLESAGDTPVRHVPRHVRPRRLAGATGVAAVSGVLVAGVAAAATLTVVFSPTHVAPLPVTQGDLQSLTSVLGLGQAGLFGTKSASVARSRATSPTPSTTPTSPSTGTAGAPRTWAYGTITWASRPTPHKTTTLQAAESAAGMTVDLPATLPAGVQGSPSFLAVPSSSVTVTFDAKAGPSLAGSSLTVSLGPGVLAEYHGDSTGTRTLDHVPALAVGAMERPTATSSGATITQLESFVLARPGIPQDLAQEIRMLGNPKEVLPIPVPAGMTRSQTSITGAPAVVVSAAGGAVSAVVWEHAGVVRTVGGFLDQQDVLGVARQLG